MNLAMAVAAAQTLLASLQSKELREFCSISGYESDLVALEKSIKTSEAVLLDADSKQEMMSRQAEAYIEKLKEAVYDGDDLLDEFVALAERKNQKRVRDGNVSITPRLFFTRLFVFSVAYRICYGVKKFRKRLGGIVENHHDFGLELDCLPFRSRREETCPFVYEPGIIGREADKEKIVHTLLDSDIQEDLSCLTILGMGGLGKTTLAQLVYNDKRVQQEFEFRVWIYAQDYDETGFNTKFILGQILETITGKKLDDDAGMELLRQKFIEHVSRKRCLFVLDDVWNESPYEWENLMKYFKGNVMRSWILVTTRSRFVAEIVGLRYIYQLDRLTEEDSWRLFERTAFEEDQSQLPDLVEIGLEIVKQCANVPLAIRVVGGLLYGQGKDKWLLFRETIPTEIRQDRNDILAVLRLSYRHLEPALKSCFSYCALFPKDFVIEKERLIWLWMAQGFVKPLDKNQTIEDAAEEYFSKLLQRCFFQDVVKDDFGEVVSFKIHDLMHDLAEDVAGKEVCELNFIPGSNNKLRHIALYDSEVIVESFDMSKYRTCLLEGLGRSVRVEALLGNFRCLRALALQDLGIKSLPNSIGELLHLRYLDISRNSCLEALPNSITKLHNLQVLDLSSVCSLKELPKNLRKLVNLRALEIKGCKMLANMPLGLDALRYLHKLPLFIVNGVGKECVIEEMENLKVLTKLKGFLEIRIKIPGSFTYVREDGCDGKYLGSKPYLKEIAIEFTHEGNDIADEIKGYEEALLEDLQPHCNLRKFTLCGFIGVRMPSWAREKQFASSLPLVKIQLENCCNLLYLDTLGTLCHLKDLKLQSLTNLEYMEIPSCRGNFVAREGELSVFCALELLHLNELPRFKGWWRGVTRGDDLNTCSSSSSSSRQSLGFPCLKKLEIVVCPELTTTFLCPSLEVMELKGINEELHILREQVVGHQTQPEPTSTSLSSNLINSKSWTLCTDDIAGCQKVVQPLEVFQDLTTMTIQCDKKLESLLEVEDMFKKCSSLKLLQISCCDKLKNVSGMEHLTALETLVIANAPSLTLTSNTAEGEEDDGLPWRSLRRTLHSLELDSIPLLVNLPEGMWYLTALQSLRIRCCKELESLPEFMRNLTSLEHLEILNCSAELEERCLNPAAVDWSNIQHIPHILFDY